MLLKGKNIIITGAGRGIGRHIAIACAKEGANLGLAARTLEQLDTTKKMIDDLQIEDVKAIVHTADVTKFEELEEAFKAFHMELGLFNGVLANAGITRRAITHEVTTERFLKVLLINVVGVYHTFKAAYPYLNKNNRKDKARFIITGSQAYRTPLPLFASYSASKYAVVGMQKAMVLEYRLENITFNQVCPQFVDTRITRGDNAEDGHRPDDYLDPWDLNDYYLFYLSEASNKVNNEFVFTEDFEKVKRIIKEAPEEKRVDWNSFKDYLEKTSERLYNDVKKNRRFIEFLLTRID
ncbi:MAG: SDR family NAD(P)-dependent oxidoreductase [Promethearchaeota archaeon]